MPLTSVKYHLRKGKRGVSPVRQHLRKFMVYYTAFKGTKYAQTSAENPIIEARDIHSAITKFGKRPYVSKGDVFKVEEV